jgi:DNA-binding LytR/AlgR family response regulator
VSEIKILVVEDDEIQAESITVVIHELGYELVSIVDNAEKALTILKTHPVDLILMDIQINDKLTGIQLAHIIKRDIDIPIIYLTSFREKEIFNEAKNSLPSAYITKPYDPHALQSAIELSVFHQEAAKLTNHPAALVRDSFFIKDNGRLLKVKFDEIMVVEVEEKYCYIITSLKRYVINIRLKDLLDKLPNDFIQIHRSYVVKKSAIEEVNYGSNEVTIRKKIFPIGKTFKTNLLQSLNYL